LQAYNAAAERWAENGELLDGISSCILTLQVGNYMVHAWHNSSCGGSRTGVNLLLVWAGFVNWPTLLPVWIQGLVLATTLPLI
jgi:hypothetical protein